MKIRIGFVSNSSSASFILDKKYLTEEDINKIKGIASHVPDYEEGSTHYDSWDIYEEIEGQLCFSTIMDNGFFLKWIRENLNIPLKALVDYSGD